jgi:hypothetical protein
LASADHENRDYQVRIEGLVEPEQMENGGMEAAATGRKID